MCPLSIHDHPTRIARPESGQGPRRVVVKFRDGLFIPYEDGAQAKLTGEVAALWTHVTSQGPLLSTLRLDRLFTSTSARRIKDLVVLARHFDRGYVSPPDFLTYFVVDCPTLTVATDFAASLARSNHVERAYVQALPGPLPSPSVNPDDPEYAGQLYLQPARRGIDAPCSWAREYGAGQGVTFADIERAWNLDHEDLLNQDGTRRVTLEQFSENRSFVGECRHGTAVLGIVMATDNAKGCVGIAPWPLKALAIGEYRRLTASAPAVHNLPDAIMRAVELLGFGDVLLLETTQQLRVPSCEVPCELDPALGTQAGGAEGRTAYDLIRLATSLGIAVIEPAGNGYKGDESKGVDFDGGDLARLARGDPAFLDSGAIIVAAAEPGVDPLALGGGNPAADTAHSPCKWSNFGKRVDCYAWGEYVNWLDWDEQSGLADYPRDFNGTSSASAIVAGVAVVVQGLARAMLGTPLSAWQLRALLHDGELGTASANPETDLIGVMPDLKKILARFDEGLVDIYVRDCVGDVGLPDPGPLAMSPDIIVRNAPVLDPQAAFGEGSGTEDDALLSEDVRYGQPQYVYVRARNRGIRASSPVKVEVFWAPPATLLTPSGWTRVGEPTVIPSVPGAGVLTVSPAITWPAADIPAAGHYCFVALISSAEDPAPTPSEFLDWEQYRAFVAGKNNVTWRNFNVVQPLPSPPVPLPPFGRCYEVDFRLVGPWNRRPRQMSLQVESDLPDGTLVEIQVSDAVASLLGLPPGRPDRDGEWRAVRFPPRGERRILAEAMLGRDLDAECRLRIRLPARAEARPHQIAILQLEQDRELGRITWRLDERRARLRCRT